jgi:signal transduction histidine kinase
VGWLPTTPDKVIRYRRGTMFLGAALIAACYPIDLMLGHGAGVLLQRAGWIGMALLGASLQRAGRPGLAYAGVHLATLASGVFVVTLVQGTGGTKSIYAGMLLVLPFAVLVAIADLPATSLVSGVLCSLGGAAIRHAEGQPAARIGAWLLLSGILTLLSAWGVVATRRNWLDELAAERDRARALEELAESERRRAAAERLAHVGHLAAEVAHEVNNPLAVVKANVAWLAGAHLPDVDPAERESVFADAAENVERISDIVLRLRTAAGLRPSGRPLLPRG